MCGNIQVFPIVGKLVFHLDQQLQATPHVVTALVVLQEGYVQCTHQLHTTLVHDLSPVNEIQQYIIHQTFVNYKTVWLKEAAKNFHHATQQHIKQ